MLQLSREYNPSHLSRPYYLDGYGSRSIGEPDWRPHPRNALSDPQALPHTKMGGNGQDWYSSIRCPPPLTPIKTQTRRKSSSESKNETFSPKITSSRKNSNESIKQHTNSSNESFKQHVSPKNNVDDRYIYQRAFELTLDKAIGTKGKGYCPRNGLPVIALGDKSYQVPEYSRNFHNYGSTRPTVSFGGITRCIPDTFIPLQDLPLKPRQTFQSEMRKIQKVQEIQEVVTLDLWKPAPGLVPSFHLPLAVLHF